MVDLDKVGNATLTNHKVSLKTFSPTTIVTSNYTFDIANEILTYGSNKIDLKKIIGSSNKYTKEDLVPSESNDNSINNGVTNITDNSNATTDGENNIGGGNSNTVIQEVKKATKRTSVISTYSTTDKINVNYVIYDPKKEYTSVYMEVHEIGTNKIDTIYLNSNDTGYVISNLFPNTTYNLTFKYSYLDENNEVSTDTFDNINVTTKKPKISIKVTSVSFGNIKYLITSDNSYDIDSATLKVFVNNEEVSSTTISINGNTVNDIYVNAVLDDNVELLLTDVKSNGKVIKDVKSSYKFKY